MISQFLLSSSLPLNANVLSFVGSSLVIADSNALISFPLLKLSFQLLSAPAPYIAILKCSHCSFPLFLLADSNRVLSLVFNHSNVIATTDVQASVSCLSFGNYPNNILYLVGLVDGVIGAYNTFLELQWKCNLSQLYQNSVTIPTPIHCLLAVSLLDVDDLPSFYTLACDSSLFIHFLVHGSLAFSLPTETIVNSMAKGAFMSVNRSKGDHETSTDNCQVVFGGENGILYVLDNYKILEYATVGYSITEVLGISHSEGKSDYVLCRGHFPGVYLYHEGKLIIHFETNDWVYAISLSDDRTLALGVMDDTIQLIKLEESIDR